MKKSRSLRLAWLTLALGCSSGPGRIEPPDIDANEAGAQAMEMYDKNADGFVAAEELDAAPSLKAAMATLDANKDDKVSADEVTARVQAWQATQGGVTSVLVYVTLNGAPVPGATVTFEPESFLGDDIQPAVGVTNREGVASPMIPKENRPEHMPPGLRLGLYKVRISKQAGGKESIPAHYNTETTLGQQVAPDDPAIMRHRIEFDLKSP